MLGLKIMLYFLVRPVLDCLFLATNTSLLTASMTSSIKVVDLTHTGRCITILNRLIVTTILINNATILDAAQCLGFFLRM